MKRYVTTWLLIVLAVVAGGCVARPFQTVPETQPEAGPEISPALENEVGERLFLWTARKLGGNYHDADLHGALERIIARLGADPRRLQVLNHSSPAALVFPGGSIGVTRGLLLALENETQAAAVIAHQIGHLEAGHLRLALRSGAPALNAAGQGWLDAVKNATGYGPEVVAALETAKALQGWRFTLEEEREADRLATARLQRAGYPPGALAEAMRIFRAGEKDGAPSSGMGGEWQYHPPGLDSLKDAALVASAPGPGFSATAAAGGFAAWQEKASREIPGYHLFEQGLDLEKEGNTRAAVAVYLQAAAALPDEPLVLTRLGLAYLQEENLRNARIHLERALMFDPDNPAACLGKGYIRLQNQEFPSARRMLEKSMELLPSLRGAFLLARACEGEGDREGARRYYEQVVLVDPEGRFGRVAAHRIQGLMKP